MNPYQSYVAFCERLGIPPMDEMRWAAGADAMPAAQSGRTNGRSAKRYHDDDKPIAGRMNNNSGHH